MHIETFIGANNLEFSISECNISNIDDIKKFCKKCKDEGVENNESLTSMKYGKWGSEEKWWAVYHKDDIVSISGAHRLPHIHTNCFVIAYRLATLNEFKGLANELVSSRMLSCFGMGRMLPYMVDWCKSKGANDIVMTFNSSANDKAYRVARKVLPRDNKFTLLYEDFLLYGAKQDVWKLNYKNLMTMETL